MTTRPVLVTGASGFAGWHLARALSRQHIVVGTFHTRPIEIAGVHTVGIDLADARRVSVLLDELDPRLVIHAAALTDANACERDPDAATRANETATRVLVDGVDTRVPDAPFVYFSTDLVYPGDRAFSRETDPTGPVMHYGRTKLAGERVAAARRGAAAILRSALLYGPPSPFKSGVTGWMRERIDSGEPLALFVDEYRTPVHIADVIAVVEALIARPWASDERLLLNLGGSERLSRFAMGEILARALGRPTDGLRPSRLADSTLAAPRPADVSMDTTRAAALAGRRLLSFQDGVKHLDPAP